MRIAERLQRGRVAFAWVFAAVFLVFADPRPATVAAGAVLLAAGAAVRTWASGHIRKREVLAVTGPYAHTRNPLYFGSFLMAAGALVMGWNPWLALALPLFAVPVYRLVILREEELLASKFGEEFSAYVRAVPRFFPRLAVPQGNRGGFEWQLVRRHREWRTWIGGAVLILVLLARCRWTGG